MTPRHRPVWAGVLAAALALGACDAAVDPFADSDLVFSLYGYLDTDADTHFVRVVALRDSIFARPGPLDARVRLETPAGTVALTDSLVPMGDGLAPGHVFYVVLEAEAGAAYRLVAERSDGAASRAAITMPPPIPAPVFPDSTARPVTAVQRVVWPGLDDPARLEVVYYVHDTVLGERVAVARPYAEAAVATEGGTAFDVNVFQDAGEIVRAFTVFVPFRERGRVEVERVEVRAATVNDAWTFADGSLDLETVAYPGRFSNVEGGFGFFGGVVRRREPWRLPTGVVDVMGFSDAQARDDERGPQP